MARSSADTRAARPIQLTGRVAAGCVHLPPRLHWHLLHAPAASGAHAPGTQPRNRAPGPVRTPLALDLTRQ